jgi:hypothetical protein
MNRKLNDPQNKILGVAIKRGEVVYSMDKPARHHDLIRKMAEAGVTAPIGHGDDVQGFLTIQGFKTRKEAGNMIGWPLFLTLFSEDLW